MARTQARVPQTIRVRGPWCSNGGRRPVIGFSGVGRDGWQVRRRGACNNFCPRRSTIAGEDGLISGPEATPADGAIQVALTTTGGTTPASALAVSRFPVADDNGDLNYNRTIDVPEAIYENLGGLHDVVDGIDLNGNGGYDDSAGRSPLAPSFFLEATIPGGSAGNG